MIAGKTWREVRRMAIAYTVILEVMLVAAILLWPSLRRGGAALVEMMPADFLKSMARAVMSPDDQTAYRAYMAVQMFFKGVNMIGIAAAVLLGTGLIARERENHTLEFLLARPVSRSRVLWGKFWVVATVIVVPVFVTSWSAVPLSWIVDEDLPMWAITVCSIHASVFVLGILAVTTWCSVVASTQVGTAFAVGGFVLVQATLYFIQEIRVASVFRLSDFDVYAPVMAENRGLGSLAGSLTAWMLLATAIVYWLADRRFRRAAL